MAKSIKSIFNNMTQGKLFRDSDGVIYPELSDIWKLISSPRQQPNDKLKAGDPVKLLVFRRYEDAILWELLAAYRIPIEGYSRLYKKQHGRNFDMKKYQTPDRIATTVGADKTITLTPDDEIYRECQKRYLLNEFERSRNWCAFCRGLGYIMILRADQELTVAGIISLPYKLKCPHVIFNKTKDRKLKRPIIAY